MDVSWVTIDRTATEKMRSDRKYRRALERSGKPLRAQAETMSDTDLIGRLRGVGLDGDRATLERLAEGALSAQQVVEQLRDAQPRERRWTERQVDWSWVSLVTLWKRWWPEKVCLELLDDKIQAGYDNTDDPTPWLDAWADVQQLCDSMSIHSIREFDERVPLTQCLYNWTQDVEEALWNAGVDNPRFMSARIAYCEEALRRFPNEDQLMTENRRRALGESYFLTGETDKADDLFDTWLTEDPTWGWGWINWADCYSTRRGTPDHARAEELLLRGFGVPGVRDRSDIADRLHILYVDIGRTDEATEFERLAKEGDREEGAEAALSWSAAFDEVGGRAVVRETTTMTFAEPGLPLDQMETVRQSLLRRGPQSVPRGKVGRNDPCPCGSGRKYKKCCGAT